MKLGRSAFAAVTLAVLLGTAAWGQAAPANRPDNLTGLHDFDFLRGTWKARHRVLKERLAGSRAWIEYDGTVTQRPLMGGWGNSGDNVFNKPGGAIRGVSLRAYDPKTAEWVVWWLDGRSPLGAVDPPIRGRFEKGVGRFYSDDTLRGKPISVRVTWTRPTPTTAHWEQAFSPDGGKTWEINWTTDFVRMSG
jgi:hypothetical protein